MCAIVDTNVFGLVFNKGNDGHKNFAPLHTWLYKGHGKLVYGGDKYAKELKGSLFLSVIAELNRMGKTVYLEPGPVNSYAKKLKKIVPDEAFDDEHLVAIVAISNCRIVCTDEKKALPFLRRRDLYPLGVKPPKIYRHAGAKSLCSKCNIIPTCNGKKLNSSVPLSLVPVAPLPV